MSTVTATTSAVPIIAAFGDSSPQDQSTAGQLISLGWEINANQYRVVHLAARFDAEMEWFACGFKSASAWIADELDCQPSTVREWIRVGHALVHLPLIDAAFAAQDISFAKVRTLTRFADEYNEADLLGLARERSARRLSAAIARYLAADGETDAERDARLHQARNVTTYTDGDGMTVMRCAAAVGCQAHCGVGRRAGSPDRPDASGEHHRRPDLDFEGHRGDGAHHGAWTKRGELGYGA